MPRVAMLVSNDTLTDVRLRKMAGGLKQRGFRPLLIGRKSKTDIKPQDDMDRRQLRIPFSKGPLFYLSLNLQLFFYLLFLKKTDVIWANDLDTLSAAALAALFRQKPLVYDSHELYTEVPELQDRPFIQKIWLLSEKLFIRRPKVIITVCQSIADYYAEKYGTTPLVIRNVPSVETTVEAATRNELGLPENMPIVIYQGAVNVGRGIEELIGAAELLPEIFVVIAGTGDLDEQIKLMIKKSSAADRILFTGRLAYTRMLQYTAHADMGVSLERNLGLNYYYALPNKLFDYIRMQIPVLVSPFPEMRRIVEEHAVGELLEDTDSKGIATGIKKVLAKPKSEYKANLKRAAQELNWENESGILDEVLEALKG